MLANLAPAFAPSELRWAGQQFCGRVYLLDERPGFRHRRNIVTTTSPVTEMVSVQKYYRNFYPSRKAKWPRLNHLTEVKNSVTLETVMENLPGAGKPKKILIGLVLFLLGAVVGAGGFYFYSQKVLIPKYKAQMMSEMFSGESPEWGDFFKKVEEEAGEEGYTNPFEGGGETSTENYVNPFDLIK